MWDIQARAEENCVGLDSDTELIAADMDNLCIDIPVAHSPQPLIQRIMQSIDYCLDDSR